MVSNILICLDCFLLVMYFIFRLSKAFRQKMDKSFAGFIIVFLFSLLIGSIVGLAYYWLGGYLQAAGFTLYSIPGFVYFLRRFFLFNQSIVCTKALNKKVISPLANDFFIGKYTPAIFFLHPCTQGETAAIFDKTPHCG